MKCYILKDEYDNLVVSSFDKTKLTSYLKELYNSAPNIKQCTITERNGMLEVDLLVKSYVKNACFAESYYYTIDECDFIE